MDQKKNEPKKSPLNQIAQFSGAGLQMGVTIWLGAQLGKYLDAEYPSDKNWFTIGCVLLAVGVSLYNLIMQLQRMNK